jgi:hypothetical protein
LTALFTDLLDLLDRLEDQIGYLKQHQWLDLFETSDTGTQEMIMDTLGTAILSLSEVTDMSLEDTGGGFGENPYDSPIEENEEFLDEEEGEDYVEPYEEENSIYMEDSYNRRSHRRRR